MSRAELIALTPWIALAVTIVAVMLLAAFVRIHGLTASVALLGLASAGVGLAVAASVGPQQATELFVVDGFTRVYVGMFLAAAAAVSVLAFSYLKAARQRPDELYLLLLLATLGAAVLAAADHFASFFLGLEILTVSLYAMVGYTRTDERAVEASVKYLVMAGATSAALLFGMALVYAQIGSMAFPDVAARLLRTPAPRPSLAAGLALMLVGIGFKLALVPFHMWTPDIYQGAPAPVAAFVATVSKGAVLAVLVRFFAHVPTTAWGPGLFAGFALLAGASMVAGNLLALRQHSLKRILAYSSIAHVGYAWVAFVAGGALGAEAVTYYLMAYFVTTLMAFGVIGALSRPEDEADALERYRGLAWRRPGLAVALAASLLSLAGIPLTAGFVGKVYVLAAGVGAARWTLVLLLVLGSAVGLFYYVRVLFALFAEAPEPRGESAPATPWSAAASLCVLGVLLLWLGLYPAPIQVLASLAASAL